MIGIHLWARMSCRSLLSLVSPSLLRASPEAGGTASSPVTRFSLPLPRTYLPVHVWKPRSPTNILRKNVREDARGPSSSRVKRPGPTSSARGPFVSSRRISYGHPLVNLTVPGPAGIYNFYTLS